jgi:hypothetical protein
MSWAALDSVEINGVIVVLIVLSSYGEPILGEEQLFIQLTCHISNKASVICRRITHTIPNHTSAAMNAFSLYMKYWIVIK